MGGKPEGYVDVAERIVEFREKYPQGSLQQLSLEFLRDFGGKDWVVYTAAAYRSPDDLMPGVGTAWEPVPGPTNFTRDSEVQNAETAAWGRALVATFAVDAKQIASAQEVAARSGVPISDVSAETAAEWAGAFAEADSVSRLQALWDDAGRSGVTRHVAIVAAKDAAKARLAVTS